MQGDGNLVYEAVDGSWFWATYTTASEGITALVLQDDGNAVLYPGAIWSTRTDGSGPPSYWLGRGGSLNNGDALVSSSGQVRLENQASDGNLYVLSLDKGSELQKLELGRGIVASPAVSDNSLVIGTTDGFLYCLGKRE